MKLYQHKYIPKKYDEFLFNQDKLDMINNLNKKKLSTNNKNNYNHNFINKNENIQAKIQDLKNKIFEIQNGRQTMISTWLVEVTHKI